MMVKQPQPSNSWAHKNNFHNLMQASLPIFEFLGLPGEAEREIERERERERGKVKNSFIQ